MLPLFHRLDSPLVEYAGRSLRSFVVGVLVAAVGMGPASRALAADPPNPPDSTAAAAPASKQKVLILRAESTVVADGTRIALTKSIHTQAVRYRQMEAILSGSDLVEEMFEFECTEAGVDCLGKIGAKYGSQLVVYSEIVKNPAGQVQLAMRVVDVAQARVAQTTSQTLDNPDKPDAAIGRGLVVLLGPVDLPSDQAEVPGTLSVTLFGGGVALVYVDDKLAGRSSVSGFKVTVTPGSHTVRVVRAGFREWSGRVTVAPGASVEQSVQLEQLADVPTPEPIGPKGAEGSIVTSWWFWTLVGGVVAGGVVAAVLLSSGSDPPINGTGAFSIDHNDAYLDPIFHGAGAP